MERETLNEEKNRMLTQWDYYKKPNGEIDCVFNKKNLVSLYGSQAQFVLNYFKKIYKCCLLPKAI